MAWQQFISHRITRESFIVFAPLSQIYLFLDHVNNYFREKIMPLCGEQQICAFSLIYTEDMNKYSIFMNNI